MRRTIITSVLAVTSVITLHAQQLDPSARLLLSGAPASAAQQAPGIHGASAEPRISVFALIDHARMDWQALADLSAHIGVEADGLCSITLPVAQLAALAEVEGITYLQAPQRAHLQLDLARADARVDEAQCYNARLASQADYASWPYTGRGIIIGQVDAGLDYRHNAFRDADGKLRIKRVWEQGTDPATAPIAGLHSPEAFGYGAEFDTPELILQAGGDTDAGSHGTHVMGIAAGSDTYLDGQFHGVAPEAELVMVAITDVGADNVRISDAIKYIFDYADSQGKPCVINLSLGSHQGPHDGTSPFDQIADALQGPGHLIVGAAGNYGADKFHLSRTFTTDDADSPSSLAAILQHEFYSAYRYGDVELWAESSLQFGVQVFDYNTHSHAEAEVQELSLEQLLDGQVHEVTLGRNVTGHIELTGEVNPLNGKTHILLRSHITNLRTNHAVALRILPLGGAGQVDLWADDAKIHFNAPDYPGFDLPTTESTITEIGGTARRILTVGAFTTRDEFRLEGSDEVYPVGMALYDLSTFSGYGPTADGRTKPEVCAPGSFIVSSVSGYDLTQIYMHSHYTDQQGHAQRYGYLQGTSMSAPMVTGAVALWLQAYPLLSPEELKDVITHTSRLDDFTLNPRYWGAGKVNVLSGLEYCLALADQQQAIEQVCEDAADASVTYYDLAGRRLASMPTHGLFITRRATR